MRKRKHSLFLLLASLLIGLSGLLYGCSDDAVEEPALFTPAEIRRLLVGEGEKLWIQHSEYYLEDSCRTGYFVRFRENARENTKLPFLADFYRDTTACNAGDTIYLSRQVVALKSPQFNTTDSLLFIDVPADTTLLPDTTVQLIRLLSSQQLILEIPQEGGESILLEYELVQEVEE
ncbi:hypothetical protein [Nafulsella turpanensis]|uniref:hypothetical protein n=1 Tax=Nafulsella turpanensis TaxID=1265690 RepID=UPI000366697F|nr:hypothetical protein [Nafulsella turpanensis]